MNSERISPFWVNGYQPFSALRSAAEKDGFFPIVPRYGKMYRKTKVCQQINNPNATVCSGNIWGSSFWSIFQKRTPTHLNVWTIRFMVVLFQLTKINTSQNRTSLSYFIMNNSTQKEFIPLRISVFPGHRKNASYHSGRTWLHNLLIRP